MEYLKKEREKPNAYIRYADDIPLFPESTDKIKINTY